MKQHISEDQLNELSEDGKLKLSQWLQDKKYVSYSINEWGPGQEVKRNMPNIGQLIEFLEESGWFNIDGSYQYHIHVDYDGWHVRKEGSDACYAEGELCDSLWQAVKKVLEEGKQ